MEATELRLDALGMGAEQMGWDGMIGSYWTILDLGSDFSGSEAKMMKIDMKIDMNMLPTLV